jgi:Protein of unknown function (DUF3237)
MSTTPNQNLPESLLSIRTRPLFVLPEAVPPLIVIGQTPNAFRRIGVIQGGSFDGTDSCIKLDVRLVLKTTDGELIVMTYTCLRARPPGVIEKLDRGELVDPTSYCFRMNPLPDGPVYNIFEVL